MDILRKAKNPGWTSEQLNVIVGSKTINEKAMAMQTYTKTNQDQRIPTVLTDYNSPQAQDKTSENVQHTKTKTTRSYTHTPLTKKRAAGRAPPPPGTTYPSLMPQVDHTDRPTSTNPDNLLRTLLVIPTHNTIPSK